MRQPLAGATVCQYTSFAAHRDHRRARVREKAQWFSLLDEAAFGHKAHRDNFRNLLISSINTLVLATQLATAVLAPPVPPLRLQLTPCAHPRAPRSLRAVPPAPAPFCPGGGACIMVFVMSAARRLPAAIGRPARDRGSNEWVPTMSLRFV